MTAVHVNRELWSFWQHGTNREQMLDTAMLLHPVNCMVGVKGRTRERERDGEKENKIWLPEWKDKRRGKKSIGSARQEEEWNIEMRLLCILQAIHTHTFHLRSHQLSIGKAMGCKGGKNLNKARAWRTTETSSKHNHVDCWQTRHTHTHTYADVCVPAHTHTHTQMRTHAPHACTHSPGSHLHSSRLKSFSLSQSRCFAQPQLTKSAHNHTHTHTHTHPERNINLLSHMGEPILVHAITQKAHFSPHLASEHRGDVWNYLVKYSLSISPYDQWPEFIYIMQKFTAEVSPLLEVIGMMQTAAAAVTVRPDVRFSTYPPSAACVREESICSPSWA